MRAEKRITSLIRYKDIDKVPASLIFGEYKARIGNSPYSVYINSVKQGSRCSIAAIKEYPQNDMFTSLDNIRYLFPFPDIHSQWYFNWKLPGKNDESFPEFIPEPNCDADFYQYLIHKGVNYLTRKDHPGSLKIMGMLMRAFFGVNRISRLADSRYLFPYGSCVFRHPTDFIMALRGNENFLNDLCSKSKIIKEAVNSVCSRIIFPNGTRLLRYARQEYISCLILCSKNLLLIDDTMFAELVISPILDLVNRFVDAEYIPILHLDGNWGSKIGLLKNLPYLKCIIHLDHNSNLEKWASEFAAHSVIMGNIDPKLFSVENLADMEQNVIRIADLAKSYKNIIISSGCELNYNSLPSQIAAFFSFAEKYGRI